MSGTNLVTFELRNGEKRVYQGVTRIDDSRRHLVLVYIDDDLIAQLNKHDVMGYTFREPEPEVPESEEASDAADTSAEEAATEPA